MNDQILTIALPTGRLGDSSIELLMKVGLFQVEDVEKRKLIIWDQKSQIKYLYVKPSDVLTYVENGIADLGIIGKDSILEEQKDIYELMDLGFGKCRFAVAGFKNQTLSDKEKAIRVATKYPNVTKNYFQQIGQPYTLIKLNGSVELAPLVGLSDVIVDIVETGSTLKANDLMILEEIMEISSQLIANKASYRIKHQKITEIMKKMTVNEG